MAYQVLARKWRPKSLSQVQGQTHVTTALTNALKRGWLHHAYLFCGTRGVGKTSLARIFAKCLNCETGVTPEPCGQCASCQDIDAGRFVDLIEVDAASRTRVEDTRDLLENVAYSPTQGRFKIYLIDEVHMLSGHSFNALLKTLEEPPEHVKFLFATTEPERIPITVLSRVLRFDLKPLSSAQIITQLCTILDAEKVTYSEQSLHYIAENAKGSMRDALSLLEQVLAFADGKLDSEDVAQLLGLTFQERLPTLMQALASKDFAACMDWLDDIAQTGADYTRVIDSIIAGLHLLSLQHKLPTCAREQAKMLGVPEAVCDLHELFDAATLQLLYQIGIMAKKDLQWAPDPRMGLQMCLLRMLDFRPSMPGSIESSPINIVATKPAEIKMEKAPSAEDASPKIDDVSPPEAMPEVASAAPLAPSIEVEPEAMPVSYAPATSKLERARQKWAVLVESLNLSGFTGMLARHCTIKDWQNTQLILALNPQQQAYLTPERQKALEDAINQKIGKKLKLRIDVEVMDVTTPDKIVKQREAQAHAKLRAEVEGDDMVQALASAFDAQIGEVTVVEGNDDN